MSCRGRSRQSWIDEGRKRAKELQISGLSDKDNSAIYRNIDIRKRTGLGKWEKFIWV